jgi:hypothetical protein
MKGGVRFFIIVVLVFSVMEMSAQMMNSNIKFRRLGEVADTRYCMFQLNKRDRYNVVVTEVNYSGKPMHRMSLSNGRKGECYYNYEMNSSMSRLVGYEVLTGIDYYNNGFAIDREPFENDVVDVSNPMRVGRGDTPDDPSVSTPLGDGVLTLLIFVVLWIIVIIRRQR